MPAIGALLASRYRIVAPLGSGGMATVHLAHDERLDRDVAVKILLPNHAGDAVLAERFEREARSLAAAAHPGVVAVFDVDPGDPAAGVEPFFVMELCPGGSLADKIADGHRLSPDDLIPILISVADGLAGLHARGVVHRDVKPSNILLAPARAKLADFGLARADDHSATSDLTAPGTAVGTLGYLAPDVLAGGQAGPPADVYALGVVAFAGLTGSMPRRATSIAELVSSGQEPAPLVSAVAPELGTAFDAPVAAALDPDPANRPDAVTFGAALTSALGRWSRGRPVAASTTAAPPVDVDADAETAVVPVPAAPRSPVPVSAEQRSNTLPGSLLAAAVIAVAIIVALALSAGPPPDLGASPSTAPSAQSTAPSESPSASLSAAPSATPSVADRALAALDGVDAAIIAAKGGGGLKGKDANTLEAKARDVRSALQAGDLDKAAKAADALASAVEKVARDIDQRPRERLENAVTAVIEILRDR